METTNLGPVAVLLASSRRLDAQVVARAVAGLLELRQIESSVEVLLTDEDLRRLNREFRGVDSATDVLSFPAGQVAPEHLGEVAVNLDFAQRQAEARGVRIEDEAAMLALHGTLHLLGMEDDTEAGARSMIEAMNEAARHAGLPTDEGWSSLPH